MHYQIFLPDTKDNEAPDRLAAVGLSDHIPGASHLLSERGPSGENAIAVGTICAWRKPGDGADHCYNAERQTWVPAAKSADGETGRYWVGFDNASPPRPSELQRHYPYAGRVMELGGQRWTIPEPQELPHDLKLADDGSLRFEVQRRFHDWFNECSDWIRRIVDHDESKGMSYPQMWDFIIKALRLNYRITPEVVSHLALFDQNNIMEAVFWALGIMEKTDK